MEQAIGKFVEGETNVVKAIGQPSEDVGEFAASRGFVRSDKLIIAATNLFVKFDIGRAAKTAALRVLVKDAADEERVISNVCAEQERLLRRGAGERDKHIGNVFAGAIVRPGESVLWRIDLVRALQLVRARESFEQRANIIAKFAIADPGLLQDVPGQDVKVKLRRDVEMSRIGKNGLDQARMIENGVARCRVAQQIDQRNAVAARAAKCADNKIEIRGGETCPTICPNHRTFRSPALTMPQPTLFEATCISVGAVSQERLARNAGDDRSKIPQEICKATVSAHNKRALFGIDQKTVDLAKMEGWLSPV